MKIRITGTFVQEYEIEPQYYTATTPEGFVAEDIREYIRFPERFVEDEFSLVVTGEVVA